MKLYKISWKSWKMKFMLNPFCTKFAVFFLHWTIFWDFSHIGETFGLKWFRQERGSITSIEVSMMMMMMRMKSIRRIIRMMRIMRMMKDDGKG